MCTWVDSLFAACPDYQRGTDCRALLPEVGCTSCTHTTDEEVCVTLAGRFTDLGGDPVVSRESTTNAVAGCGDTGGNT